MITTYLGAFFPAPLQSTVLHGSVSQLGALQIKDSRGTAICLEQISLEFLPFKIKEVAIKTEKQLEEDWKKIHRQSDKREKMDTLIRLSPRMHTLQLHVPRHAGQTL